MMTDKEMLVELIPKCFQKCLRTKCTECEHSDKSPETGSNRFCQAYLFADHLIANGVTVQEWISVKDRLPEFTEEEIEKYRFFGDTFFPEFNVMILGAMQATTLYFDGERWYDEENHCYCVTHWMPLPEPPKGD